MLRSKSKRELRREEKRELIERKKQRLAKMMSNKFARIVWLAVVFVACSRSYAAIEVADEASPTDMLRASFVHFEQELWSIIENGVDQPSVGRHILDEYRKFVEANLTQNFIGNNYVFMERVYEWKILEKDIFSLNNIFEVFRPILEKRFDQIERHELTDFTETVLSDPLYSVNDTLNKIENLMIKQGLYYRVALVSFDLGCCCFVHVLTTPIFCLFFCFLIQQEALTQVCSTRQSAQQVLYQLYNAISITEIKGYAMMQFSWMILRTYGNGE